MSQLSVSNEAVIAKYRERVAGLVHENVVLSAALDEVHGQLSQRDAQVAALQAEATERCPAD